MNRPCPANSVRDPDRLVVGQFYSFTSDSTGHTRECGKYLGTRQQVEFDAETGRETNRVTTHYRFQNFLYTKAYSQSRRVSGCFTPILAKVYTRKASEYALRRGYERATGKSGEPGHGPANILAEYANLGRKHRTSKQTRRVRK